MAALSWRGAALLLWLLALWNCLAYRGLYWDGASFLVHMIEDGRFHDGHTARAHILWATQWPAVIAIRLGITDTALLSMAYSVGLFALPTALYHLALYRVRNDPPLLAAVLAIIVTVYLATCFFIVGEFNAAYAAATATAAVALTSREMGWRDGGILCALGFLCLRSYEAMLYIGPLLAAMTVWIALRHRAGSPLGRLLGLTAAGFFIGAAIVSFMVTFTFWDNEYYVRVRAAAFDFWQNLQFMIGGATLALFTLTIVLRPSWLRTRIPFVMLGVGAVVFAVSPWLREIRELALLYPPAHYVSRTAAGALLWLMLAAMWLFVAWTRHRPRLFVLLAEPQVGRRLIAALFGLLLAASVPDIVLTRMWTEYLDGFRALIVGHKGFVQARDVAFYDWPAKLFRQGWSYPPLSLILRNAPTDAMVMPALEYGEPPLYEPACGIPALTGYAWRR